jgi:cytochrome c oxidase assembly protein subunit 11
MVNGNGGAEMNEIRRRNRWVVAGAGAILAVMTGLVIYAPTLYQLFCNATGYGGTVQRSTGVQPAASAGDETVTIAFDANVAPGLPWEFRPEQRTVRTHFGEPARINYIARNNSDETIVARASYNVTPYKAAPYFFKIECFCFTEEKLGPHESAEMPVVLYVDEQLRNDPNTEEVRELTLSYTFFRQTDLSDEEIESTRDLKSGSAAIAATLDGGGAAPFDNDAPRQ